MIGTILRQRYKIIQKLGEGGFGKTYLAEDLDIPTNPKPKCVVKVLDPHPNNQNIPEEDILRLFNQEAETLYKLGQNHDQIPKLYAYFEDRKELYIVQEFIDGNDLSQEIIFGQPWSETEVIKFLEEILEVLAFVHQKNVIHRDIKPSNILRRTSDNKLVLIDFGLVKTSTISGNFTPSIPIGSRGYAPPEQGRGRPQLSSDIYALGIIAIQALTGIDNPLKLDEDASGEIIWRNSAKISDELGNFLTKMVQSNFRYRYQSALETLPALRLVKNAIKYHALCPVEIDKKWGYQDIKTGKILIKPQFDQIDLSYVFDEELAAVKIGQKWGYVNRLGQIIIDPKFDECDVFTNDLAAVRIGNKWGYINRLGQIVIVPKFDQVYKFYKMSAIVKIDGKYGVIDKKGQFVIKPDFDHAEYFYNGFLKVKINNKYGILDTNYNFILSVDYDYISNDFDDQRLIKIRINQKWGYINMYGSIIIQPQFDDVDEFDTYEKLAAVKIQGKWGYINTKGNIVIHPQFEWATRFWEGMAEIGLNNKSGYINPKGEIVIKPKFDYGDSFTEGLAVVKIGKKYGYINTKGEIVIKPQFDYAHFFEGEFAFVEFGSQQYYINKNGHLVS